MHSSGGFFLAYEAKPDQAKISLIRQNRGGTAYTYGMTKGETYSAILFPKNIFFKKICFFSIFYLTKGILRDMMYYTRGGIEWIYN